MINWLRLVICQRKVRKHDACCHLLQSFIKRTDHNFSLPTQEKACAEYCKKNGFDVAKIFIEEGESAKTAERTQFQQLISYCRENKSRIQFVIVYAVNRFARNKYDHFAIRTLLQGFGISLRSVTEPIDDSSIGKFLEGVLASFAQFDNDVKSDRTINHMKDGIQAGRWMFKPPLGYHQTVAKKGFSSIIPDPERAPLIQKAFELFATGLYTKIYVLDTVTKLGLRTVKGKKVSPQTFDQTLRKPIYAGWLSVKGWGERTRGNFTPLITQEVFDKVQNILSGKKATITPHVRNHPDFPLRQFVRCGKCSRLLTGSWSKGRNKRYPYYRCPNSQCKASNVRKSDLEGLFIEYLGLLQPKPEYLILFKEIVLDVWKTKQAQFLADGKVKRRQLEDLKEKKQRLIDCFVYEKAIDRETYQGQLDSLNQDIALLEIEVNEARLEELDVEAVLNFSECIILNASRLWIEATSPQKQRFQKVLFPSGIEFSDGKFRTTATTSIFNMLQKEHAEKTTMVAPTGFEPVSLP